MELAEREIKLKNGDSCSIRSLNASDAAMALVYLKTVMGETPFMTREPEEVTLSVEEEAAFLEKRRTSLDGVQLGAFWNDALVGIASVERATKMRRGCHRGTYAIGLKEKAWGLGMGTQLSQILFSLMPQLSISQLELGVMAHNKRAISLYEKLGFRPYGTLPNASRLKNGEVLDEILMYLTL